MEQREKKKRTTRTPGSFVSCLHLVPTRKRTTTNHNTPKKKTSEHLITQSSPVWTYQFSLGCLSDEGYPWGYSLSSLFLRLRPVPYRIDSRTADLAEENMASRKKTTIVFTSCCASALFFSYIERGSASSVPLHLLPVLSFFSLSLGISSLYIVHCPPPPPPSRQP